MAGGAAMTMKSIRRRSSSSRATRPASTVLPRPTSSAIKRLTRGSRKRLAQRQKLIGIEPDARPKRRLQQIPVGGGRGSPSYRAKMGGQHFRPVGEPGADIPPSVLIEHDGADFGVPEDFQPLTLSIVGDAREIEGLKVVRFALDFLDQPRTAAKFDETSRFDRRPNSLQHHLSRFPGLSV